MSIPVPAVLDVLVAAGDGRDPRGVRSGESPPAAVRSTALDARQLQHDVALLVARGHLAMAQRPDDRVRDDLAERVLYTRTAEGRR